MFIKSLDLFSLLLGLQSDIFGYVVNVLHDGFDLSDIFFSLLDYFFQVIHFSMDLDPIYLSLV